MLTLCPTPGASLKDFPGSVITEDDDPVMLQEVRFIEIAAVCDGDLAHLAVGQFHAARVHGDDARAHLVAEIANRFRR